MAGVLQSAAVRANVMDVDGGLAARLRDELREYERCARDGSLTSTARAECGRIAEQLQCALDELGAKRLMSGLG